MIWKISGKPRPSLLKHFMKTNIEATNQKDIADILADTFSTNSLLKNANQQLLTFKLQILQLQNLKETFHINRTNWSHRKITQQSAQMKSITNSLNIYQKSLDNLLTTLNDIWINGRFPESWKISTIILIQKPRKKSSNLENQRPIALRAAIGKPWSVWSEKDWFSL